MDRPAGRQCSADSHALPALPISGKHDLEDEFDAGFAAHPLPNLLAQSAHVAGRAGLVVDDEVGVLFADRGATDAHAFHAQAINQATSGVARWVAKDTSRRGLTERLMLLTPLANVVESFADDRRLGLLQVEGGPRDDFRTARR